MKTMPAYSGLRQYAQARSTGTHVGIYLNAEAGLDDDGGTKPWSTKCEEHGGVAKHASWRYARWYSTAPENWCPTCQRLAETAGM